MKKFTFSTVKSKILQLTGKKSVRDYGTVLSYDVLNKVIAGLCNIIVVRMLLTEEYANYTLFNSIASIVSSMVGSGITTAFLRVSVKNRSIGKSDDSGYYTLSMFVIWTASLVLFLFNQIFISIYKTSFLIVALSIVEAAVLSQCRLNVFVYQTREKYGRAGKIYNLRNVVIFAALILICLLVKDRQAWHVMSGAILAGLLALFMSFFALRKLEDFKFPSRHVEKDEIKRLFFEIKWLITYFSLLALINATDIIVLNRFTNSYYVANYGVAFKYYTLLLSLLPSITAILRVKASAKEYEESSESRVTFLRNWLKKASIIAAAGMLIIPPVSYFLWDWVNGPGYALAYWCFLIFMIGAMLSYMFAPMVNFVLAANMHKKLCLLAAGALVFNLVGNYILVQKYAAIGVSITTVISQAILNVGSTVALLLYDKKLERNQ